MENELTVKICKNFPVPFCHMSYIFDMEGLSVINQDKVS